jgi:hypothetical protein
MKKRVHYPKPQKLKEELELDSVNKHRKLDCIFYDFCLDHAADFVYKSFSCKKDCDYYHKQQMSDEDKTALIKMAREITND